MSEMKRLDVSEKVTLEAPEGEELEFTVVALLEDEDAEAEYAVLVHEPENDDEEEIFIVTDVFGTLLQDESLAQEVLDDYLMYSEQSHEDGET